MASDRGSSLDAFADFALSTRQYAISDPDTLVSQASKYKATLFKLMMAGLSKEQMIQAGTEIVDITQLKYVNKRKARNFQDQYSFSGTNTLVKLSAPWRKYTIDDVVYEAELDLQQGGRDVVFKKRRNALDSNMELSFWEGNVEDLWADPNFDTMEASALVGTGQQYSLRCLITDDGGLPASGNGGIASGSSAWTTFMGQDPANFGNNFKNQFATYDNTSQATREATYLPAMDRTWRLCGWQSPSSREEYVKSTTFQKMRIINNLETDLLLTKLARTGNNVLTPVHDPGYQSGEVVFHGIQFVFVDALGVNVDTGSDTGTTNKYRSRWINFNYVFPVWHPKHYRRMQQKDGGIVYPDAKVFIEDSWQNIWFAGRRMHGITRAA